MLHSRPLLLHFGDTSFLSVAEEAAATLEVWAEEKRQKIDVEGDRNLFVSADRSILRQAIINLLDNAIKYSPAESFILLRVHRVMATRQFSMSLTKDQEYRRNTNRTFLTGSTVSIKRVRGSGAAQVLDCPLRAAPSKSTVAKSP